MLIVSLLIFAIGVAILLRGMRGHVVGEDPHCRACEFNLRGRDPSSARCPECGTELRDATIRIGLRQRRRGLIVAGLVMALIGGALPGLTTVRFVRDYPWARWKTTAWLLDDLESTDSRTRSEARRELRRRVDLNLLSPSTGGWLMEQILARQADQSKKWDTTLGELFEAAAWAKRVDPQRIERYLKQGVTAKLELKPKLRRGQQAFVGVQIRCDRYSSSAQLRGTWGASPLLIGDHEMREEGWVGDPLEGSLAQKILHSSSVDSRAWRRFGDSGKYEARTTVKMTMSISAPFESGLPPVMVDLPISAPVEVDAEDANIDEFKVDPQLRERMRAAFGAARVNVDENNVQARLLVTSPPMAIAAEVVIRQGPTTQRVGTLLLEANARPHWESVSWPRKSNLSGVVDLVIRPSQSAADGKRTLGTYWGEEIVIPDITINAPHETPFNRDDSLRPQVEKALRARPMVKRGGQGDHAMSVHINVQSAPVKLAYDVFVSAGGREIKCNSGLIVPANQNHGIQLLCREVDPDGNAASCDVILRPKMDWEANSFDLTPPWFGQVIIGDVKIE